MAGVLDLIVEAIRGKKQVLAIYDGLRREMCPHVVGYKDGNPHCLFYQFAGESSGTIYPQGDPRAYQNWRCMDIDKLSNVRLRDGEWYSLSWHKRRQTCVDEILEQVTGWL